MQHTISMNIFHIQIFYYTNNKQNQLIYKKYRNKTNKFVCKARNKLVKKGICDKFKNPKKNGPLLIGSRADL